METRTLVIEIAYRSDLSLDEDREGVIGLTTGMLIDFLTGNSTVSIISVQVQP